MSAIPYMPFYVADYLSDAAHLTTEEHGAYLLLIMTYWQRGKPLPADSSRLANIARMTNERWASVERTLNEFFTVDGDTWRHKRIDAELEKFQIRSEKAKQAGKASGESRKPTSVERPLNVRSSGVELGGNHTDTDTIGKKEDANASSKENRKAEEPEGFKDFWDAYPKRAGSADRKPAVKAFVAALRRADMETILHAAKRYAADMQAAGKLRTEFVKQARTWLNADGWAEYEAKPETNGTPVNSGIYVRYGTDPGDAWERHYRAKGKVPPRDFKGGWYFPSEYPHRRLHETIC